MCGIAGWRSFTGVPNKRVLMRMTQRLAHRGPDSSGIKIMQRTGFGFRRLAIIDTRMQGNQPMTSSTGKSTIIFNGEIYNFQELKKHVRGYKFTSRTDTEVILALYEKYGEKCVQYLRGMFAFAIWDHTEKRLFIARDRLGKKPLYFFWNGSEFLFASELKALQEHPLCTRLTLDADAVRLYSMFGYVPAPYSIYTEVRKLPPAHTLTLSNEGQLSLNEYWDVDFNKKTTLTYDQAKRKLRSLFFEAVKLRMISDVSIGAFLSGGIDSTAVVAAMARQSKTPVRTFSVGFSEKAYDELASARAVAQRYGTKHTEIRLTPDFITDIPRIMACFDEPFADGSCIPTYYIARATRKHVTVALNGDGGDENFAGYTRYVHGMRTRHVRLWPMRKRMLPLTGWRRIRELLGMPNRERFFSLNTSFEQRHVHPTVRPRLLDPFTEFYARPHRLLDKWLYTDMKTYLPGDLLVKVDIATMANALEARSPFLDHKLVEFAASLPPRWKLSRGNTKLILKDALADLYPVEILQKPKQGFAVPIEEWMRGPLLSYTRKELLAKSDVLELFDKEKITQMLALQERKGGYGYRLWHLLMLREWEKAQQKGRLRARRQR